MMKRFLGILVLSLLLASCSEYQVKKYLENCATKTYIEGGEGKRANKYYYTENDWVIIKNQKFLNKTKKMVEQLPDVVPATEYYKKIENIHSMSFDEKVKILHTDWVHIKDNSDNVYIGLYMLSYMLERSDLLKKTIPKLSLKKKRDLVGFIEFYENCEIKSRINPETFKLKYQK